jgi:ferredoxin
MTGPAWVIDRDRLGNLLKVLTSSGYQVIGPRLEDETIVYGMLEHDDQLPAGYVDEQDGGHYRLIKAPTGGGDEHSLFRYTVGPHSWKQYLFPAQQALWRAARTEGGAFGIEPIEAGSPSYAFIGVRACELAAIHVQDRVFDNGAYADSGYLGRRDAALIVAVNCTRAGGTCFCTSMGTGPAVGEGADLTLTELLDAQGHRFLVQAGSDRGRQILAQLSPAPADPVDQETATTLVEAAAASMGRRMPAEAAQTLSQNPEHPRWLDVAERCLSCANCTLVCPTCFCSTVEDRTSLDGSLAERHRRWDSCFNMDFSYIHGGAVRRETASRYRQWITHKLAHWHEQFGTSGCTGCGRCITWCPVGIDITEEVAAIEASANTDSGEP